MQAIEADALAELGDDEAGAPLTVALAVNADSLATWFVAALAAAGPGLAFDIRRADQTRTAELLRDGTRDGGGDRGRRARVRMHGAAGSGTCATGRARRRRSWRGGLPTG